MKFMNPSHTYFFLSTGSYSASREFSVLTQETGDQSTMFLQGNKGHSFLTHDLDLIWWFFDGAQDFANNGVPML